MVSNEQKGGLTKFVLDDPEGTFRKGEPAQIGNLLFGHQLKALGIKPARLPNSKLTMTQLSNLVTHVSPEGSGMSVRIGINDPFHPTSSSGDPRLNDLLTEKYGLAVDPATGMRSIKLPGGFKVALNASDIRESEAEHRFFPVQIAVSSVFGTQPWAADTLAYLSPEETGRPVTPSTAGKFLEGVGKLATDLHRALPQNVRPVTIYFRKPVR